MNELYWITKVDFIISIFTIFLLFSTILLFYSIFSYSKYIDSFTVSPKFVKTVFIIFIISLIGVIFIPNKHDLLLMYKTNHPKSDIKTLVL